MSRPAPFDASVSTAPTRRSAVLAPERDVATGHYGSRRGRDAKRRHDDARPRDRRLRPWHAVAGVAVVAAGAAGVVAASSGGGSSAVATTSTAPPTTLAPTTIAPTTTLSPESRLAESLAATYHVVETVVDGNVNFAVGTVRTYDLTFTSMCSDGVCTLSSPGFYNVPAVTVGDRITIHASPTEPCPAVNGATVPGVITDSLDMVLRVSDTTSPLPQQLTGTLDLSSPEAARCGVGNDPISKSMVLTRAG
jgi:hypothetical protein